ncbi:maleylpyruvate isomerase family mycothiol-dependent enzyme [Blastococcus jejuensis]|uniref:maleylpyruvate isomerase family mycothiol-dependent enzyme n=1 Tax=Blastococcus jejuensis TaxID=351224 RepID=UPI0031E2AA93
MSTREWTTAATALFLDAVDRLSDEQLAAPSALPGWSRAHVVAHVHGNALALGRLASWAATGTESRMYSSREARDAEIEQLAALPAAELRKLAHASAEELGRALDGLSPDQWQQPVVTATGRTVPATEIPWIRAREVAVHAVDLDAGVTFADLPDDLRTAVAVEVVTKRAAGPEGPALTAWLTGRSTEAPTLGPWL